MRPDARRRAESLAADLRAIVADRLRALVVFGGDAGDGEDGLDPAGEPVHTLALVQALDYTDLEACARQTGAWRRRGLATPLLIGADEFARSLDAFPLEFGAIIATHDVIAGADPFTDLQVRPDDLRRACEVQVRSHLLHLREGYLEAGGDPAAITRLVTDSAPALAALLATLARSEQAPARTPEALVAYAARALGTAAPALADVVALTTARVPVADAARLYPAYLREVEQLAAYVDRGSAAP